jgi:hypothetical protein
MSHPLNYIFRRAGGHIFLCASDSKARYEMACGHCDYPILADQAQCPRCRRELETCPCCNALRHVRSPRHDPDPETEIKTCPVCGVRRVPFGSREHVDLEGSFCTNIFGCPAGGLLLTTGEFALLPRGASLCPICRHESLRPLSVSAFDDLREGCFFCRECFGERDSWKAGWRLPSFGRDLAASFQMPPVDTCPLCGRRDHLMKDGKVICVPRFDGGVPEEVAAEEYPGLLALGRAFIQEASDQNVERILFAPPSPSHRELSRWIEGLLVGTHLPAIRKILERRTRNLLEEYRREFGPERQRTGLNSKRHTGSLP